MEKKRLWGTLHPFFESGEIMGRSVANEGFVTAFLNASPYDGHHFFLADEPSATALRKRLKRLFPDKAAAGSFSVRTRHDLPDALARNEYEVFHLSDCITDAVPLIRLRNAVSRSMFAVTGTTHSLSYARYAAAFLDWLWPGVTGRDAILATSRAGEGAVAAMFAALRAGYALPPESGPRIMRVPLGVNSADFAPPAEKGALAAAVRRKLGLPERHLMLLVFARVSHHAKMDVLPLLRALLRAESLGLPRGGYVLVLAGWVDVEEVAAAYATIAGRLGIAFKLVPAPDNALRRELFAGADIFLSPVDNPQETFGLTILEAGASSLPVVASDFDGYRDLVLHGETGFLIPTHGPAATPESDALSGVWFDNQRHLQLAQQCVVSVPAMAEAIGTLAANAALRAQFGAAAYKRVRAEFTWERVVERHLHVWDELARTPVTRPEDTHPLHPGFSAVFGGYYSGLFDAATVAAMRVRVTAFGEAVYRRKDFPAIYGGVERLVDMENVWKILFRARHPVPLAELLPEKLSSPEAERAAFPVLWALKHDLLEQAPSDP